MTARAPERTGETLWAQGVMCKAVAQSVLLNGREIWVVTGEMLKVLTEKRGAGGEWEYPSVEEAMEAAGIHPIGVYIKRWNMNIAERVACRTVYALFTEAE